MTTPTAKDVARELDKRHRRRRLIILGGWAVLVVLAALYLRCGRGWGLGGGGGTGTGNGSGSAAAAPHRCQARVTAKGLELEGKPATQDAIVSGCPQGVDVIVTGDARQGDWDALKAALDAAHVPVFTR
jgi:hypothetical protein